MTQQQKEILRDESIGVEIVESDNEIGKTRIMLSFETREKAVLFMTTLQDVLND